LTGIDGANTAAQISAKAIRRIVFAMLYPP
jgi:hypothetical protein